MKLSLRIEAFPSQLFRPTNFTEIWNTCQGKGLRKRRNWIASWELVDKMFEKGLKGQENKDFSKFKIILQI